MLRLLVCLRGRDIEKDTNEGNKATEKEKSVYVPPPPYKPPLAFPQRKKQALVDQQFKKFLDVINKIYINIPFTEAASKCLPMLSSSRKSCQTRGR